MPSSPIALLASHQILRIFAWRSFAKKTRHRPNMTAVNALIGVLILWPLKLNWGFSPRLSGSLAAMTCVYQALGP
jgi:hypothetical protein